MDAALQRAPRCRERRRVLDGAGEAQLIAVMCSEPPAGQARWTLKLACERLVALDVVASISHESVRKGFKKTPSNPGNGVAHLMQFYAPFIGWRRLDVADNPAALQWAHGVRTLVEHDFPHAKRITLVMDNLNTHTLALHL